MKNQDIILELKRIADASGGVLLPEAVVEAAKPLTSVLHNRFEWNDTVAGEAYRLWQARQLISVSVELIDSNDPSTLSKVFVSLAEDRRAGTGYRSLVSVMSDEAMREKLLRDALAQMEFFEKKYQRLQELAKVFEVMHEVKKEVKV